MHLIRLPWVIVLLLLVLPGGTLAGQQTLERPLRVYLDCNEFRCDRDFLTQEIRWVAFVRDRQVADVHVLGTRQRTGAGGSVFTFELRGQDMFEGERITLRATTLPDATDSEERSELLRVIRLGLAPFAESTTDAPVAEFQAPAVSEELVQQTQQDDPWDRWVFRLGVDGNMSGESQQRSVRTSAEVSASRITADWKLLLEADESMNETEYPDDDAEGGTYTYSRESYSAEGLAVRSLGPHWGIGVMGEWRRSTYNNYKSSAVGAAAVEYNIFPYEESTRRLLTLFYAIGPRHNVYQDTTIFGETEEVLIQQLLGASYDVVQPWGEIDVRATLDHFITKFGDGTDWDDPQFNASFSGSVQLRLIRGLSVRIRGGATMVRGQIQLPASGLTPEEILTEQRELATDYRYYVSFGFSYRFGSIYSAVVNPRFESF